MLFQEVLRNHCPDIPALRRAVSRVRIWALDRRMMDDRERNSGESSFEEKERLVEAWRKSDPGYYKKICGKASALFDSVWKDNDHKKALMTDVLFCRYAYGFLPEEYLCFGLEEKGMMERLSFVSDLQRIRYDCQMSDMADSRIFKDKSKTYEKYKDYYSRELAVIERKKDKDIFLSFISKHPRFLKKEVFESIGRGIELIDYESCGMDADSLFEYCLRHGKVVLEEIVKQSEIMAGFNASSVNTVRCITLNTKKGIKILCTVLRVGRTGRFVDNAGFGGLFAAINKETGLVETDGCSKLNERYQKHPDSGKPFKGFQVPDWENLLDLCREMAEMVPTVRYIGWDMAYTEKGWVLIEGNNCPQIGMIQISTQNGIKKELEKYMSIMELMA